MMEIVNLTVRFGGVTPLDDLTVTFDSGTCGLIGPNGAGKTTLFNVLSGFVRPASGSVRAFGEDLLAMPHYKRARWGLRRTFQTEQAIEELSVAENVALAHEHSRQSMRAAGRGWRAWNASGASRRADVQAALTFVGLEVAPNVKVETLGARDRRLVEIARAIVGRPRVVLLDEPAAGLPDEETRHVGSVIRSIPERTGALVVLVDHDMDLVSACCETTAVLDFGKLIAAGPTADVLRDEHVVRAYLGTEPIGTEPVS
ncbi:MAG TPA: ATP-binding cassette domain-containing protein [Micromonosporaceae bacterium]|jgi:branched-chain amino acid transport system ATP-binding protein